MNFREIRQFAERTLSPKDYFVKRARELAPTSGAVASRNSIIQTPSIDVFLIKGRRENLELSVIRVRYWALGLSEFYREDRIDLHGDGRLIQVRSDLDFEPDIPIAHTEPVTEEVLLDPKTLKDFGKRMEKEPFFAPPSSEFKTAEILADIARGMVGRRIQRYLGRNKKS